MATPAAVVSSLVKIDGLKTSLVQLREFDAANKKAADGSDKMSEASKSQNKALSGLKKAAEVSAVAIGGAFVFAVRAGWKEMEQQQKVAAQTNAVIKSTGGVANVTAKQVDSLATSLMQKSGVDDETIKSGENLLLTFTNVRNEVGRGNDIFNQATKAALDMSVAMGTDMHGAAIRIGKALQDPIKGISALRRVGVNFSQEQSDMIKQWVEQGQTLKAQKYILHELNVEFGGSATAAGKTLPGQLNILKETFNNLAGDMVARMLPAINWVVGGLVTFVNQIGTGKGIGGEFGTIVGGAFDVVKTGVEGVIGLIGGVENFKKMIEATATAFLMLRGAALGLAIVQAILDPWTLLFAAVAAGVYLIYKNWSVVGPYIKSTLQDIYATGKPILDWMQNAFTNTSAWVKQAWTDMTSWITTAWHAVVNYLGPTVSNLGIIFTQAFNIIKTVVSPFAAMIKSVMDPVLAVLGVVIHVVSIALVGAFKTAVSLIAPVINAMVQIISGGMDVIRGIIKTFAGILTLDFDKMWSGIKQIFSGAFTLLKGIVSGGLTVLEKLISGAWNTFWSAAKYLFGAIGSGFKSALNTVIDVLWGFLKDIVWVLNRLPFVDIHIADKAPHFAEGGVQAAAKGKKVTRPGYFAGEEAPRHPEYILATNPAYHQRNVGLWMQAGGALGIPGFAQGSIVTASMYSDHGPGAFGLVPDVQAVPGFAELNMGKALGGLPPGQQILVSYGGKTIGLPKLDIGLGGPGLNGHVRAIDLTMPAARTLNFPGLADVLWGLPGAGGGTGVGDVVGAVGSIVSNIIGKLPKPPALPSWIAGIGTTILDQAKEFIKKTVGSMVLGSDKFLGDMSPTWDLMEAMAAQFRVASGGAGQRTRPGDVGSYHAIGRARDYSGASADMLAFARVIAHAYGKKLLEEIHTPLGWGIKNGQIVDQNQVYGAVLKDHYSHVHVAFRRGGMWPPWGGSFADGGIVPGPAGAPRTIIAHGGERMGGEIKVIIHDGAVDPNKIEVIAEDAAIKVTRDQSRAGMRTSRLPGSRSGR